jgi:hypothetical protein
MENLPLELIRKILKKVVWSDYRSVLPVLVVCRDFYDSVKIEVGKIRKEHSYCMTKRYLTKPDRASIFCCTYVGEKRCGPWIELIENVEKNTRAVVSFGMCYGGKIDPKATARV